MSDHAETRTLRLRVNGRAFERQVETRMLLSDFIRHELELTGTHVGCEHGVCGACTILVDGRSARSCLMLAVQAQDRDLVTIEGLASGGRLHPIQEALSAHHGLQCGFCTPGVLISLVELLRDNSSPSDDEIRETLSGHLCRCTGYEGIVRATLDAARRLRERGISI